MKPIVVVPPSSTARAEPFLEAAGWRSAAERSGPDASAARSLAATGRPVLFVPEKVELRAPLHRILVVHEGTRGDRAGIDAADEAAVASGAEVIVLHVPSLAPSRTPASLPHRFSDHGTYDWEEWRDEFLRRFCRCSEGVQVSLLVAAPSVAGIVEQIRGEHADLLLTSIEIGPERRTRTAVDAVFDGAAPVLMVPAVGHDR
jgi:hypothetical protein